METSTIRTFVKAHSQEVIEYLKSEFGGLQDCEFALCGVVAPPAGSVIDVLQPLQTCHESSGDRLDGQQCIPPGTYKVGTVDPGRSSHCLYLIPIVDGEEHPERAVMGFIGYSDSSTVDWRGARKHVS